MKAKTSSRIGNLLKLIFNGKFVNIYKQILDVNSFYIYLSNISILSYSVFIGARMNRLKKYSLLFSLMIPMVFFACKSTGSDEDISENTFEIEFESTKGGEVTTKDFEIEEFRWKKIRAEADNGYVFDRWESDPKDACTFEDDEDPTTEIKCEKEASVKAYFKEESTSSSKEDKSSDSRHSSEEDNKSSDTNSSNDENNQSSEESSSSDKSSNHEDSSSSDINSSSSSEENPNSSSKEESSSSEKDGGSSSSETDSSSSSEENPVSSDDSSSSEADLSSDGNSSSSEDSSSSKESSSSTVIIGGTFVPADGKTLLMIGQTFRDEYEDYAAAYNAPPAGSSHYGDLYLGNLNQGHDSDNASTGGHLYFWKFMNETYPGAYAQVAIAIKDNVAGAGYSGDNAVWKGMNDIMKGNYDSNINSFINDLKQAPDLKILLRIGYEVSINMFALKDNVSQQALNEKYGPKGINIMEQPELVEEYDIEMYKNVYNKIAEMVLDAGLTNVEFVFHPVRGIGNMKHLYPGDEHVDWIGISLFNGDLCMQTYEGNGGTSPIYSNPCTVKEKLDPAWEDALDWAKEETGKPLLIAEAAAQTHPQQSSHTHFDTYFTEIQSVIEKWDFKAFIYINSWWNKGDPGRGWPDFWGDSRVEESPYESDWETNFINNERYLNYDDIK